jgi:3-mercaptopyruvate sulfurtransferase SseA
VSIGVPGVPGQVVSANPMWLDWYKIQQTKTSSTYCVSGESAAILLALLANFDTSTQWLYDDSELTASQWDEIQAALAKAIEELSTVCP